MLTSEEVVDGYIGARERSGMLHAGPYIYPEDAPYPETLSFNASAPNGFSAKENRQRIDRWREAFPHMTARHLVLAGPRLDQETFDAAVKIKGLEILVVYQSSIENIESISDATALIGVRIQSSKPVLSHEPFGHLPHLRSLTLDNPKHLGDLGFMGALPLIEDFSVFHNADRWLMLDSLSPLRGLLNLQRICLRGVKISNGGLRPLHGLPRLANAMLSYVFKASEFADFREATPALRHGSPFEADLIAEFCED